MKSIDEDALRREVAGLMRYFVAVTTPDGRERTKRALPYMLEAHRRMCETDIGMDRFISPDALTGRV